MMENEKARPDAATPGQATETVLYGDNTAPAYNTNIGAGKGQVLELISIGRDNAQTARELARVTGLSRREVMAQIQAARLRGERICSSPGNPAGFWIAENPAEYERAIKELSKRAGEQRQTIEAMEQSLARWIAQDRMEGF